MMSAFVLAAGSSAQPAEPPVRIMPLGDSLTSGVSGSTVVGAYRNRLYTLLTNAGYNVDFVGTFNDSTNPGLPDTNHQGQGSARIDQIQANLAGWLNSVEDPDVVLLLIGTNDFWQNYQLSTVQSRLSALIADIASREPHAKIILSNLPLRTDNPTINSQQVAFNNSLPALVAEQVALGRQVSLLDMYSTLTPADINGDGVHPNQTGSDKMGAAWFPAVASVISPKGTSNPPVIARVAATGGASQVAVTFSKPVSDSSANPANFTIQGLTVNTATLDAATKRVVTLGTSTISPGLVYNLSVSNVRDRTILQTPIAPGSMASFSMTALANGGFESNLNSWVFSGNLDIQNTPPYVTTEGTRLLSLNNGQRTPNAVVSQTFATTAGQSYQLAFDVGAMGYNTNEQRCQIAVTGTSQLVSDTIAVRAPGGGGTRWLARTYNFTANSASTTITFTDVSTNTDSIDLVLDNVRVGARATRSLAVNSLPTTGAAVTISPADIAGATGGSTGLLRQYDDGTTVTVTAPPTLGANNFIRWQRNGVDLPGSQPAITLTLNSNQTLTAVYGSNNAPIAAADAYSTPAGTPLVVPAAGVLTNDIDPDGGSLAASVNAPPLNGTLTLSTNGGFTYTPANGFTGTDSFTYSANDGVQSSAPTTVSITVHQGFSQLLVNGSFESNLTAWSNTGNVVTQSAAPYTMTDGSRLAAFNAGQTTPNGVLTQSFATVAGQTYQLALDVGAFGFSTAAQTLEVRLDGAANITTRTFPVNGLGGGATRWTAQTVPFTATGPTTTLSLRDVSTTSNIIDLVVDNVRVTGSVPNHTLTIESSPAAGTPVAISPPDRNGASGGTTTISRSYSQGSVVNLSAPASISGSAFQRWRKNGVDHSTNRNTSVTIDAATTMTAVFGTNAAPVAAGESYDTLINTPLTTPPPGVLSNDTDADLNPLTAALVSPPANGTVTLSPDGGFTYTPATGYVGPDSFTYRASDGAANSAPATVSINVSAVAPGTIINGSFELREAGWTMDGNRLVIDSLAPYLSSEGTKLLVLNGAQTTPTGVISQTFGTVAGQTYQIDLDMGIVGAAGSQQSLKLTLTGASELLSRTETIISTGTPNALWIPKSFTFVANSASTTLVIEDKSVDTNAVDLLLDNVRISAGTSRSLTVASSLGSGVPVTVSPNDLAALGNGTTQFTRFYSEGITVNLGAPANHSGNVFVKWQKDGVDYSTLRNTDVTLGAANVAMTAVYRPNTAPVAQADTYQVEMESTLTVAAASGVLDNDSDVDSEPLTAVIVAGASNGTVTLKQDGSFIYQPNTGFSGTDSFTYKATDGALDSNIVTVSITVNPFATGALVNGSFEEGETGWTITGNRIVVDSSAPYVATDGGKLMVGNGGNVSANAVISQTIATTPGKTYTLSLDVGVVAAGPGAVGAEQTLRVSASGSAAVLNQLVTVTSTSSTDATWVPQSFTFVADSATTTISLGDESSTGNNRDLLIDNVRCAIRIDRTLTVSTSPANGVAISVAPDDMNGAGSGVSDFTRTYPNGAAVTLTAPATAGSGDFMKWTRNGVDFATTATVTVNMTGSFTMQAVYGSNTAPVASPNSYTTTEGVQLVVPAPGVLGNDTDAESSTLTAVLDTGTANGTLNLSQNGGFTYQPNPGFSGTDSFTYRASDGVLTSNLVTVNLTVEGIASGSLVNGSFEAGETGWSMAGNRLVIDSSSPYTSTDEVKLMVFNAGQVPANAVISQGIATTPGQQYVLEFNLGVVGVAGIEQRLGVEVNGSGNLVSRVETVTAAGTSAALWSARSIPFTANSTTTTVRLADLSTTGTNVDLLLDNVRVLRAGSRTLTVTSAVSGLNIGISPADLAGNSAGVTRMNRFYNDGAQVTVTAPATFGGSDFLKWTRNGADFSVDASVNVTLDANITLHAVYAAPPQLLVNGSFEQDYTGWTRSGNQIISTSLPATDGTKAVEFNGGQLPANGQLSQTFPTIAGQTYQLTFDLGVFALNTDTQRMQVTVVGGASQLLGQTIPIQGQNGPARWVPQSLSFVANGSTATLAFQDVSTTSINLDLLLDNVRVTGPSVQRTLTVESQPSAGAPITVSPIDRNGFGSAAAPFNRSYNHGSTVSLTAPATFGGLPFSRWTKNGVQAGVTPAIIIQLDGDHTYAAVYAPNTPPAAANDSHTVTAGSTLNVPAPGVLANDTDAELNPLTASIVTNPASGTLVLNPDGGFTYTPNSGFTGSDSFTYRANDGMDNSAPATVAIEVQAAPARTLTVQSSGAVAVPVTVSPADSGGAANGTTTFTRTYPSGTSVTLTAPANQGSSIFQKWQRDGTDLATTPAVTTTLDADRTLTAVYQMPPAVNLLVNGSFESDFTGWNRTGNLEIQSAAPYVPTDGNRIVSFNSGQTTPNGVLSQTFATVPGTTYALAFDAGVLSYTTAPQRIQVGVTGNGSLFNQTLTITRTAGSNTLWLPQSFTFVANSTTSTLSFTDVSASTAALDLTLDNVRVTSNSGLQPLPVLTVNSTPVQAAVAVSPNDVNGNGNGTANFSRVYAPGTSVTLSAAVSQGETSFIKWQRNGVDFSTTPSITITLDQSQTYTAFYSQPGFANGSFETGTFAPWTTSGGSTGSVRINSVFGGTNGTNIVEFNASNSPNGGVLSQTFATIPGVTYSLNFDLGVYSFITSQQTVRVGVTGSGSLLSQTTSITGSANGAVRWEARSYSFTANSTSTTLTFTDLSTVTTAIDMLIDNVRVSNASARTLTVGAVSSGAVNVTVSPNDNAGLGNGTAQFIRTYNNGTSVTLTAPASANGGSFSKWVRDGADLTTSNSTTVTINADTTLIAVYSGGNFPPLGSNLIQNGSFELSPDFVSWATTGATRIEKPQASSGFPTDGNNILSFNVGGGANNGVVTQQFATTAGTTYTLQLDVGVYGGPGGAAIDQTIDIRAIGVGIPLQRTVTVRGSSSAFVWAPQTFTFTADSALTTLRLADASSTGAGTDLFVDNVRVRSGTLAPSTLTISTTPTSGQTITVNTPDLAGQGNGSTTFTRIYNTGANVQMVAPFQNFVKWLKNGQWYATNPTISVVADGNHTMTAVYTQTPVVGPFVNGSFEGEFTGWTWTGSQQSVKIKDGLPAADGLLLIEFNSNSSANDGAISQTFTTTPGTVYNVTFDMGVLAYNTASQTLQVSATGNGSLLTQSFSLSGNGLGTVRWSSRSVSFTANSATTTLTFRDRSATGAGLDLLLDNVRLNGSSGAGVPRTLTVTSTPATGAAITVSPADNASLANGTTQFTRTYFNGTNVTLTAPSTFGGNTFVKWQRNGVDSATTAATTVTMDANVTMTAVYAAPGSVVNFVNGSFEQGLTGWTTAGSPNTVVTDSSLAGTNGSTIAKFNSANTANDGSLSQSFATTPGTSYTVNFDMGLLSFLTTPQSLRVTASGSGTLVSQTFSMSGNTGGATTWTARSVTFTANTSNTTLTFADASTSTNALDLLLDNVRVTANPAAIPQASLPPPPDMQESAMSFESGEGTALIPDQLAISGNPGDISIRMLATEPGRYFLERSDDLRFWTETAEQTIAEPGLIEFHDSDAPATRRFYRIGRNPADTGN